MAISNQKVLLRSHAGLTITINDICDDEDDDSDDNCNEHGVKMNTVNMMMLMMFKVPFRKFD